MKTKCCECCGWSDVFKEKCVCWHHTILYIDDKNNKTWAYLNVKKDECCSDWKEK